MSSRLLRRKFAPPAKLIGSSLLNNLYAAWPLDEASGSRVDVIGGRNLTPQGSTAAAAGKHNNCTSHPDTTAYLVSPATLTLGQDDSGVSWSCWVRRSVPDTNTCGAFNAATATSPSWGIRSNVTSGTLNVFIRDGTNTQVSISPASGNVCNDAWHLVIMVWNENHDKKLHLYVPTYGLSFESAVQGSELLWTTAINHAVHVGRAASTTFPWGDAGVNAYVDEPYIWSRALTLAERTDLYNAGAGKFYPFG